jgi:hypothetical protein
MGTPIGESRGLLAPSHAGTRPPDGGRVCSRALEINWHRWRYRRAARRRDGRRSTGLAWPRPLRVPVGAVA